METYSKVLLIQKPTNMNLTSIKSFFFQIFSFAKNLFAEFGKDGAVSLAAALAYFTVFSIAPMLVIVISVSGIFLGHEAVNGQLYEQLSGLLGTNTAEQIQEVVKNVYISGKANLATLISIGALLFSATAVVGQLKNAINRAWNIKEDPKNGILAYLKNRLLSLTFILSLGFVFLVSLGLNSIAAFFSDEILAHFPYASKVFTFTIPVLLSGIITLIIFMLLFKFLPDAIIQWKDVFAGALFTTILFTVGKYLIGLYIGNSNITSTFGSAGALASLMLWVYYSAMILILGAEFTQLWAKNRAAQIKPKKNAVRVVRKEIDPAYEEVIVKKE